MTYDPVYEEEDGWIVHKYPLATGNALRFQARDVRRERTGIHAQVAMSLNWITLAWTNLNVERDEDRVRLSNSAYRHLKGPEHELDAAEFPDNLFKHALDLFCFGLWDHVVGVRMGGLMAGDPNRAPARPLLGNYMLDEGGTLLFAPPGQGKTYTALTMGVSLAYGVELLWPVFEARWPLYINVERSGVSMAARLARVNRALGLDAETPLPFLNGRGRSLTDIYEAAERTMRAEKCGYVIYDSISRAGQGSMVADDVANRIMDMLNALSPSWLALAHSPREDQSHAYGSQMFDAAADLVIGLRAQTSANRLSTGIGLEGTKANDLPLPKMAIHVFEWGDEGLSGVRRARSGEFADLEASEHQSLEDEIASLLLKVGTGSAVGIADALGRNRSRVSNVLNRSHRFVQAGRRGREILYGVQAQEQAL